MQQAAVMQQALDLFISLCWAAFFGWLAMRMAAKRNRDARSWMVAGVILGPFAVGFLYFLPERHSHAQRP
jgi:predicted Kef-type K+ transport protein